MFPNTSLGVTVSVMGEPAVYGTRMSTVSPPLKTDSAPCPETTATVVSPDEAPERISTVFSPPTPRRLDVSPSDAMTATRSLNTPAVVGVYEQISEPSSDDPASRTAQLNPHPSGIVPSGWQSSAADVLRHAVAVTFSPVAFIP